MKILSALVITGILFMSATSDADELLGPQDDKIKLSAKVIRVCHISASRFVLTSRPCEQVTATVDKLRKQRKAMEAATRVDKKPT